MKKIYNWLFHHWYVKTLKQQESSPFKMKMETDTLKSNCILEIQNDIEPLWFAIKRDAYKLGIKTVQNNRARLHRDDYGKQTVHPDPVFTENQIAELKSKFWQYRFVLIAFCISESFLYGLTASLFVPGGGLLLQVPVAIFLAVLIMLALDYGYSKHFQYREVKERNGKKELTDVELKKYIDERNIGYVLIIMSFAAIIVSGFARIFFMEFIPKKGLPPDRMASITNASKMASILTLLITVIAGIYMAVLKRDQGKTGIRYRVYKAWHNAHVLRNNYTQLLIRNANKLVVIAEQHMEKYWQLVIDLKRVYKMKTEYDEKYEALHQEYVELKAKPGLRLNDDLYEKFECIQCVYGGLFKYGILNAKEIKDKIVYAIEILKVPEEHLAEHLSAIAKHKAKSKQVILVPSSNGKTKDQEFSIH